MFSDLNVPVPTLSKQQLAQAASASKKGKAKQDQNVSVPPAFTPAQVAAIESRLDLLVHCQYRIHRAFFCSNCGSVSRIHCIRVQSDSGTQSRSEDLREYVGFVATAAAEKIGSRIFKKIDDSVGRGKRKRVRAGTFS